MSITRIEPGARFGAYQIVGPLGRGGMATVWKAYETSLDRYVALKVLPAEFLHEPTFAARFQREARVVAKLEHPNIVPIFAYGIEGEIPWMSMRLIAGPGGGSSHLAALLQDGRVLPRRRAVEILTAVADALSYAHDQGVLHRDVKPQNILLDETGRVYLADFGIARMLEGEAALTRTGLVSGTPQYMAPEHAMGTPLDHRVDVYALGTVAYEMLTGATPFSADTPVAVLFKHVSSPIPVPPADYVPEPLLGPLLRSLAKDPAERFERATDFTDALARGLAELPAEPTPPPARRTGAAGTSAPTASTAPTFTSAPTVRTAASVTDPTVAVSRGTVPVAGQSAGVAAAAAASAMPPKRGLAVLLLALAAVAALAAVGLAAWWRGHRAGSENERAAARTSASSPAPPTSAGPPADARGTVAPAKPAPPPEASLAPGTSAPAAGNEARLSPSEPPASTATPRPARTPRPAPPIRAQAPAGVETTPADPVPAPPAPAPAPTFPAGSMPWRLGARLPVGLTSGPAKLDAVQFKTLPKGELEAQFETTCADGQDQLLTFDVALYGEGGAKLANFGGERSLDEGDQATFRKKFKVSPATLAAARMFRVTIQSADD
jgi:serine/threonine protein kinase